MRRHGTGGRRGWSARAVDRFAKLRTGLLGRRTLPRLAVFLAIALVYLPALRAPFAGDDHFHRAVANGTYPARLGPFDLFTFVTESSRAALVGNGIQQWSLNPHMVVHFFRPISSALAWIDHRSFPDDAFWPHAHSLLWLSVASLGVFSLLRDMFSARVAWMGALVFALAPCNAVPVAYLANRAPLVSIAFGTFALAAYARWRERGDWQDGFASTVLFGLALSAGEYGLGFAGYVVAIEAVKRREPIPRRLRGVAIFALALVVYFLSRVELLGAPFRAAPPIAIRYTIRGRSLAWHQGALHSC